MKIKTICAAVLAGVMLVGCDEEKKEAATADQAVVTVNGLQLTASRLEQQVDAHIAERGKGIPANQLEYAKQMIRSKLVEMFISKSVLITKAKAEGFSVTDEEVKAEGEKILKSLANSPNAPKTLDELFAKAPFGVEVARKEFRESVLLTKFVMSRIEKMPKGDYSAEAKKIYDQAVSNNAQVVAAEKKALKKIESFRKMLAKVPAKDLPKRFAEIAKSNSECPSAKDGGDLHEFTHGAMVPEFDKVAFELKVGELSQPVRTKFGYHLILVTEKHPAVEAKGDKPAEPEKVRASHILIKCAEKQGVPKLADIEKFVAQRDQGETFQKLVDGLIQQADIQAVDEYKHFLPQKKSAAPAKASGATDAPAKKAAVPVEKPATK